jgi:hypothetical protein
MRWVGPAFDPSTKTQGCVGPGFDPCTKKEKRQKKKKKKNRKQNRQGYALCHSDSPKPQGPGD